MHSSPRSSQRGMASPQFPQPHPHPIPQSGTLHQRTGPHPHIPTPTLNGTESIKHEDHTEDHTDSGSDAATGRTPYFLRSQVVADRQDRESLSISPADYGTRWRAAFRAMTGEAPECGPGEHAKARLYWLRLREAIRIGHWSPSEWSNLYRQERVWRERAAGRDARFEVMGTRKGRADPEQRKMIGTMAIMVQMQKMAKGISK